MGKLEEAGTSVEVIGYWTRDELQRTGSVGKFSRRWQRRHSNHEMNMMRYIFEKVRHSKTGPRRWCDVG